MRVFRLKNEKTLSKNIDKYIAKNTPENFKFLKKIFNAYLHSMLQSSSIKEYLDLLDSRISLLSEAESSMGLSSHSLLLSAFPKDIQYYYSNEYIPILLYSINHKDSYLLKLIAQNLFSGYYELVYGDSFDKNLVLWYTDGSNVYPYKQDKPYTDSSIFAVSEQSTSRIVSVVFLSDVRPDGASERFPDLADYSTFDSSVKKSAKFLTYVLPARVSVLISPSYSTYYNGNEQDAVGIVDIGKSLAENSATRKVLQNKSSSALKRIYTKVSSGQGYASNLVISNEDRLFTYQFRVTGYYSEDKVTLPSNLSSLVSHVFKPVLSVNPHKALTSSSVMYFKLYIDYPIKKINNLTNINITPVNKGFNSMKGEPLTAETTETTQYLPTSKASSDGVYSVSYTSTTEPEVNKVPGIENGAWEIYRTINHTYALSKEDKGIYYLTETGFVPCKLIHPVSKEATDFTHGSWFIPVDTQISLLFTGLDIINQDYKYSVYTNNGTTFYYTESKLKGAFSAPTLGLGNSQTVTVAGSNYNSNLVTSLDYGSKVDESLYFDKAPENYYNGIAYCTYETNKYVWKDGNLPKIGDIDYSKSFWEQPIYNSGHGIFISNSLSMLGLVFSTDGKNWRNSNITQNQYSRPFYSEEYSRYFTYQTKFGNLESSVPGTGIYCSMDGNTWKSCLFHLDTHVLPTETRLRVLSVIESQVNMDIVICAEYNGEVALYSFNGELSDDQTPIFTKQTSSDFKDLVDTSRVFNFSESTKLFTTETMDLCYDYENSYFLLRGAEAVWTQPNLSNVPDITAHKWTSLDYSILNDFYFIYTDSPASSARTLISFKVD